MYPGSATRRPMSSLGPAPGPPLLSETVGRQRRLAAGVVLDVLPRQVLVEAHLGALARVDAARVLLLARLDVVAPRLLRRQPVRRRRSRRVLRDVVDPLAVGEQAVRLRVVRLP